MRRSLRRTQSSRKGGPAAPVIYGGYYRKFSMIFCLGNLSIRQGFSSSEVQRQKTGAGFSLWFFAFFFWFSWDLSPVSSYPPRRSLVLHKKSDKSLLPRVIHIFHMVFHKGFPLSPQWFFRFLPFSSKPWNKGYPRWENLISVDIKPFQSKISLFFRENFSGQGSKPR